MKSLRNSLITIVMATTLAIALSAQQSSSKSQEQNQGMQGMQGMQKGQTQNGNTSQMMQNCRNTMQPMMQTNAQAKKDIEAAKASNDPAKMRAALAEAEKAIDGMNTHMNSCMSMMQNMQGMMGNMMGAQQSKPSQNPPKQ
jgi:Na+-transporting NADH:ubiquinone oxidoreductase subunit NqrC